MVYGYYVISDEIQPDLSILATMRTFDLRNDGVQEINGIQSRQVIYVNSNVDEWSTDDLDKATSPEALSLMADDYKKVSLTQGDFVKLIIRISKMNHRTSKTKTYPKLYPNKKSPRLIKAKELLNNSFIWLILRRSGGFEPTTPEYV